MSHRFKPGNILAAIYLLLVFAVCIPLAKDVAIHHGNGIAFLAATILTLPLSWLFLWIIDNVTSVNAFYMTGWSYVLTMCVIIGCALFNAGMIKYLVARLLAKESNVPE